MDENDEKISESGSPKKTRKGCLIAVAAAALIMGFLVFEVYKTMIPVDYRIFTEERINALEQEYNMDLSGAEPERYWVAILGPDHPRDRFCFHVDDYHEFMENSYFGTVVSCYESDDRAYAEYKCKPYYNDNLEFKITFEKNGERYDADPVSW